MWDLPGSSHPCHLLGSNRMATLRRFQALWRESPAARGLAALLSGTAVAQAIVFATVLAIARLYGPDAFGVFALVVSVATAFVPLATLKTEIAIVPAQSDLDAYRIARNAAVLALCFAVILAVLGPILSAFGALNWLGDSPQY